MIIDDNKFIPVIRHGEVHFYDINNRNLEWKHYSFGLHKIVKSNIPLRPPILIDRINTEEK